MARSAPSLPTTWLAQCVEIQNLVFVSFLELGWKICSAYEFVSIPEWLGKIKKKKKSFVERLNLERGLCVMIKNEMGPMWARFIERNEEMFCCLRSPWCYRWFMWCVASVMVLMAKHALSSKHLHLNVFIIEGAHKWTLTQIHSYGNIHSCLQICVGVNEYM